MTSRLGIIAIRDKALFGGRGMTDIVQRLRSPSRFALKAEAEDRLFLDAADEIERLRALTAWQTHGCAVVKITADDYEDVKADLILEDFCRTNGGVWHLELLNDSADEKNAP